MPNWLLNRAFTTRYTALSIRFSFDASLFCGMSKRLSVMKSEAHGVDGGPNNGAMATRVSVPARAAPSEMAADTSRNVPADDA
jgi:hypothetical protein